MMEPDDWPDEPAQRLLDIEVIERSPRRSVVELTVGDDMLNGHGICHGGILFLLADTAMAHTSNSGKAAVASHAEIDFLEPVPNHSRLRATALRRAARGRMEIWDVAVEIRDPDGDSEDRLVAEFRGRTIEIRT